MDTLLPFQTESAFVPPAPSFAQFKAGVDPGSGSAFSMAFPQQPQHTALSALAAGVGAPPQPPQPPQPPPLAKRVPVFIRRLWTILSEASYPDVLFWAPPRAFASMGSAAAVIATAAALTAGPSTSTAAAATTGRSCSTRGIPFDSQAPASFVIADTAEFNERVLPKLLKFANYAIFVRQLSEYGFVRVPVPRSAHSDGAGASAAEADGAAPGTDAFYNPHFRQGAPHLLRMIVRSKRTAEPPNDVQREAAPSIQTLVMQLAMLQLQAQESRAMVEAVKQEVINSQQRQSVLQEFTSRLAASASASSPSSAAAMAAVLSSSSSQPSSQTSSTSSTSSVVPPPLPPDASPQYIVQHALEQVKQDLQMSQSAGLLGPCVPQPQPQPQPPQSPSAAGLLVPQQTSAASSVPMPQPMAVPAPAVAAPHSVDSLVGGQYANPPRFQSVPPQPFYSAAGSYSGGYPAPLPQQVLPPATPPPASPTQPPQIPLPPGLVSPSLQNSSFFQYVQSLVKQQQQQQIQIDQQQQTVNFLMQQQQQQRQQQQQQQVVPPVLQMTDQPGAFALAAQPAESAAPQEPVGMLAQDDPSPLSNGNFSPLTGDSDVLLEDIPQNSAARLASGLGGTTFTDDTERMYWERYMDPSHF